MVEEKSRRPKGGAIQDEWMLDKKNVESEKNPERKTISQVKQLESGVPLRIKGILDRIVREMLLITIREIK